MLHLYLYPRCYEYRRAHASPDSDEEESEADSSQRGAFNSLSVDKKNRAPIERVQGAQLPQRISLTAGGVKHKANAKASTVYQVCAWSSLN